MKRRSVLAGSCIVLAIVLMQAFVGCTSTGYQQAEKSVLSMNVTRQELVSAKSQVTRTSRALDAVVNGQGNLVPKYEHFGQELKDLDKAAKQARWRADRMQKDTTRYFDGWAKDIGKIQDPQMKSQSMQRRSKAIRSYNGVIKSMFDIGDDYVPLLSNFNDIQISLKQDLTSSGVKSIAPQVNKARQDSAGLQRGIDTLMAEIDRVSAEWAPEGSGQY